jgi:type IX secretion system substrate protein/fibronectin type III domain protein
MNKLKCLFFSFLFSFPIALFQLASAQPIISSFTPASGPVGTLVTIDGTDLSNPTSFTIGGVAAIVISNDGSTLVGMVMPGTTTGIISVTTGGGTTNSSESFTVISNSLLPTEQQGNKLVGTGSVGTPYQGHSVSLSADGNTAIVGGYYDNSGIGAAWIYIRSGNTWTQQGSKLIGSGYTGVSSFQGVSVSLSADGNTAIVGGQSDNSNIGAVWIYTRNGSIWTQQGGKLVGSGYIGTSAQGHAVSLSADGNTAIVGGFVDNSNIGAVWIFTRSGSTWTQQGSKLVGTAFTGASYQGVSVSLSADGNTAMAGGYQDNSGIGAAWIFTRSGSTWTQQGSKLVGTAYTGTPNQGHSVSLSADGNTAIAGGYQDNSGIGAAWVFTRSDNIWTQQGNKLLGTGASGSSGQGVSVSLTADGNIAMVGGYMDNSNIGAAWIYRRSGNTWTQQGSKLVGTAYTGTSYQGISVSLNADGNTALVGGFQDNNGIGAAWVYITLPEPPLAQAASGILSAGFTANWSASIGATGYKLDVDDNNDFSSPLVNDLDVENITSKAITGLTPSTTYYYRARAYNDNGTGVSSNVITLTTLQTQTITFEALSDKTYGDTPFDLSATGGGSGNPVTFTSSYETVVSCSGANGETLTILKAGSCSIYANQAGDESYEAAPQVEQTLIINKATPVITWSDPDDIVENTALSTTQLNATADVTGTFIYTPSAGTILTVGNNQPLEAAFAPDDDTNYNSTSETVYINVSTVTGTEDIINKCEINIYPNPVKNELVIEMGGYESVIDVIICDLKGKIIMKRTKISSPATIDMSELASGLYIIHIETDKGIITSRIVKE